MSDRVCRQSNASFLRRADDAVHQRNRHAECPSDGHGLQARIERRSNEICLTFRDFGNLGGFNRRRNLSGCARRRTLVGSARRSVPFPSCDLCLYRRLQTLQFRVFHMPERCCEICWKGDERTRRCISRYRRRTLRHNSNAYPFTYPLWSDNNE